MGRGGAGGRIKRKGWGVGEVRKLEVDSGEQDCQELFFKHAPTRFMVLCKYLAREGSTVSLVFPLHVMHKLRPCVRIPGT
jgi:hypothetical protein